MYRLLIADDEIISRLGIANLLEWESEGFQLIDSVENGQLALDVLRKQSIDLVLTDIKMPVMTGIELIRTARQEGMHTQFIVLSSYDDYSYVREALKLGALDYILKLDLNKEYIQSVLKKAGEQINQVSKVSTPMDRQTLNSARRDFLKQLFYGKIALDSSIDEHLHHLQLNLSQRNYITLMFKIESSKNTAGEAGIRTVIEEILEEYEFAYISGTGYSEMCVLYNLGGKEKLDIYKCVERLAKRILYIMKQYFNQKSVIYISETMQNRDEIPLSYQQVTQAYSSKNIVSDESIVFYKDIMKKRKDRENIDLESYVYQFEKAIQRKKHPEVENLFEEILKQVDSSAYLELGQISSFVFSLSYVINQYLSEMGGGIHIWKSDEERYKALQAIRSREEFIDYLGKMREILKDAKVEESDNHIIRNVKKYLNDHYKEGVVLKEVAEQFSLTNTYLSMLFRKETGMTLKDYLIGLKIEKTKELLKETNMQIAEISKEIGYDNEHYFSRIFKQKTGMTPTAFRNSGTL